MKKDWTGNYKSIFTTLGASSHAIGERQDNDYYATDPKAIDLLFEQEQFENVRECACGEGHLAKKIDEYGKLNEATDIIYRGYGGGGVDFLLGRNGEGFWTNGFYDGDIITNPTYKYGKEFVEKAIEYVKEGRKVAMFLKLQFLEGKDRKKLFLKYPPRVIYVSSSRLSCAKNGDFDKYPSSAVAYGWYVWEKGFNGNTIIKWIN